MSASGSTRRRLLPLAAGAMLLATAAAPAAAQDVQTSGWESLGDVTLRLAGEKASETTLTALAAQFMEAYPNVTVELELKDWDSFMGTVLNIADSNDAPDIIFGNQGYTVDGPLVEAGLILPLDAYYDAYGWNDWYGDGAKAQFRFTEDGMDFGAGNLYGIAESADFVGVYYNVDKLAALGLEVPTTFAEFEAALATIKDAGITPIATGGGDAWPLAHVWEQLIHGNVPFEQLTALEVDLDPTARYDSPEMIAATAKLLEWYEKGYFNEGMLGTSYLDANNLFINEQAAINIGGTWAQPEFATQPEFEARFFPMPQMNPELEWHAGGKTPGDVLVVTSYAEDQAAALGLLDYLLGEENARRLWDAGKFVTYRFDEVPPPVTQLQADIYDAMQRTGPGYYMGVSCAEVNRGNWAALQGMIAGDTDPAGTMAVTQGIYENDCPKYRTAG